MRASAQPWIRRLAWAHATVRLAIGTALFVRPNTTARPWLGDGVASAGGLVALRAFAVRDAAIGAGILWGLARGRPVRHWFTLGLAFEAVDSGATIVRRSELPATRVPDLFSALGAVGLIGGAIVAAGLDEDDDGMFATAVHGYDWIAAAPVSVACEAEVAAPADRVWATLADHESWREWFPVLRKVRPDGDCSGVGGTRTVWAGPARLREEMVEWEPARRLAYSITSLNLPFIRAMTESWDLTPTSPSTTTVRYRIGIEPGRPARFAILPMRSVLEAVVGAGVRGLQAVSRHPHTQIR